MNYIPTSTFVYLIISVALCILLPMAFVIYLGKKQRVSTKIMVSGVICFIVFVVIIESIIHQMVLGNLFSKESNPFLYAVYGGVMAALFEVCARYVGLKFMVKEKSSVGYALQFGLGYGLAEVLVVGVMPLASNLATAVNINKYGVEEFINKAAEAGATSDAIDAFRAGLPAFFENNIQCLYGGFERIFALALQIALSIIVFQAIREGHKNKDYVYLVVAFVVHFITDFGAALYQAGKIENMLVVELFTLFMAAVACIIARMLYVKNVDEFGGAVNEQSSYS